MNENIKRLREETGVGFMQAKKAYEKADGDYEKALLALQEEGWRIAENRTAKPTRHSTIGYYVHGNQRLGALVELCCETDLTASSDFFNRFANEIAMHIAAKDPKYLSKDDVPKELLYETDLQMECLLEQKYFRDEDKTIRELLMEFIYTHKENTEIKRFICYHAVRQV